MKQRILMILSLVVLVVAFSGCTKRCRCQKFSSEFVYFTPDEVSAQGKTCAQMKYRQGMFTQYYSYCEWVFD